MINKTLFVLALMMVILAASIASNIYMHEQVHQSIFLEDGIKSTVHYRWWGGYTMPEKACITQACSLGHNINEAVAYNLQPIIIILSGWMILWVFFRLTDEVDK